MSTRTGGAAAPKRSAPRSAGPRSSAQGALTPHLEGRGAEGHPSSPADSPPAPRLSPPPPATGMQLGHGGEQETPRRADPATPSPPGAPRHPQPPSTCSSPEPRPQVAGFRPLLGHSSERLPPVCLSLSPLPSPARGLASRERGGLRTPPGPLPATAAEEQEPPAPLKHARPRGPPALPRSDTTNQPAGFPRAHTRGRRRLPAPPSRARRAFCLRGSRRRTFPPAGRAGLVGPRLPLGVGWKMAPGSSSIAFRGRKEPVGTAEFMFFWGGHGGGSEGGSAAR